MKNTFLFTLAISLLAVCFGANAQTVRNTHASISVQANLNTFVASQSLAAYSDTASLYEARGQASLFRRFAPPDVSSGCAEGWFCAVSGEMPWDPLSPRSGVTFPIRNCGNIGGSTIGQITASLPDATECGVFPPCQNGAAVANASADSGISSTESSSVSMSIYGGSEVRPGGSQPCELVSTNDEVSGCLSVRHVWNVTDFQSFTSSTVLSLSMAIWASNGDGDPSCSPAPESKKKANASITVRVQGPGNYDKSFTFVHRSSAKSQALIQTSSSFPLLGTVSNNVWNYNDGIVSFGDGVTSIFADNCGSPSCPCQSRVKIGTLQFKNGVNTTSEPTFTLNPTQNGLWTVSVQSSAITADIDFGGAGPVLVEPIVCDSGTAPATCSTLPVTRDPDGLTDYRDLIRVAAAEGSQNGSCRYITRVDLDRDGSITDTEVDDSLCSEMADFNLDGFLDFFDYDGYVAAFLAGDCVADVNKDGFLDFFDYDRFSYVYNEAPDCTFIVRAGCANVQ
jgi:hypothetical protein